MGIDYYACSDVIIEWETLQELFPDITNNMTLDTLDADPYALDDEEEDECRATREAWLKLQAAFKDRYGLELDFRDGHYIADDDGPDGEVIFVVNEAMQFKPSLKDIEGKLKHMTWLEAC